MLVLEMPPGDAAAVLAVIGLSAHPAGDELPLGVCPVAPVCVWVEDEEVVDVERPAGRRGAGEEAVGAAGAQLEQRLRGVRKVGEEHRRRLVRGEGVRVLHRGGERNGVEQLKLPRHVFHFYSSLPHGRTALRHTVRPSLACRSHPHRHSRPPR